MRNAVQASSAEDEVGVEVSIDSATEALIQEALQRLQEDCIFLKLLGSYPRTPKPQER